MRARFERALGHDFSRVRIHADASAANAADAAGALAYTIGRDVVFGGGRYQPYDHEGARLLAHELVHVVQQGDAPRIGGASASEVIEGFRREGTGQSAASREPAASGTAQARTCDGVSDDAFEQEADRLAEQVVSGQTSLAPALCGASGLQAQVERPRLLTGELRQPPPPPSIMPGSIPEAFVVPEIPAPPQLQLTGLLSGAPTQPSVPSMVPQLIGPPPVTPMAIIPVPRCVPDRSLTWADFAATRPASGGFAAVTVMNIGPPFNVQGNPMFQLRLGGSSGVRNRYRDPANRASNGCAAPVAACRREMNARPGITWSFNAPAVNTCLASILPSTVLQATTVAECDTVIGTECDRAAQAESARLLAHEQGHFSLACALVNKANDALRAGTATTAVDSALTSAQAAQQGAYDTQTNHGCNAGPQATWDAAIAAGLPAVTIP